MGSSINPAGRKGYLDVAKALGIIAIVVFHALPPPPIGAALLSFGLPLFFFVSGALYKDAYTEHPVAYSWRRFKRLWIPYAGWGLFYLALHNVFIRVNVMSDRFIWEGEPLARLMTGPELAYRALRILAFYWVEHMGGALWFLPVLFMTSVAFVTVSWVSNRVAPTRAEVIRLVVIAALVAAGYLNQQLVTFPGGLNIALVALLFFYSGYAYRSLADRIPWRWDLGAAAVAVIAVWGPAVSIGKLTFTSPVHLLVVPLSGIYVCLLVGRALEHNRFLGYLGRNTMLVLATHFLAFKLVSLWVVSVNHWPPYRLADFPAIPGGSWWLLYSAAGVLVPLAARYAVEPILAGARQWMASRTERVAPSSLQG